MRIINHEYYLIDKNIKDLVIWFRIILLIKIDLFKSKKEIFLNGKSIGLLFAKNLIKESVTTIVEKISINLLI